MATFLTFPVLRRTNFMYPDAMFRTPQRPTHGGVDFTPLIVGQSVPIYAVEDGTILISDRTNNKGDTSGLDIMLLGRYTGIRWWYGHLSRVDVSVGQTVSRGKIIGMTGTTGSTATGKPSSTGVHLHLEAHYPRINVEIDPWTWLWDAPDAEGSKMPLSPTREAAKSQYDDYKSGSGDTAKASLELGATLRLSGWRGFENEGLTDRQSVLLSGDYKVVEVAGNGSIKVSGLDGRTSWLHPSASAGLIKDTTPIPPQKTEAEIEEEELMSAKDEIIEAFRAEARLIESRMRREVRPEVYFIREGADGKQYTVDNSPAAVAMQPASGFILPLNPSDKDGKRDQIESLKANYRLIGFDSNPVGLSESAFYNNIKDVARGAGILDRNISHDEGVAWAKALFA